MIQHAEMNPDYRQASREGLVETLQAMQEMARLVEAMSADNWHIGSQRAQGLDAAQEFLDLHPTCAAIWDHYLTTQAVNVRDAGNSDIERILVGANGTPGVIE
jgi:hypothetical protein